MWDEWYDFERQEESEGDSHFNFDFFSVLSKPKVELYFSLFVNIKSCRFFFFFGNIFRYFLLAGLLQDFGSGF